jgi:hypothetical protein
MWLVSLALGLLIAWAIVTYVNSMSRKVSYYAQMPVTTSELSQVDQSLVAVGLAQYPEVPSIMDSVNKPTQYKPAPAPAPVVIQAAAPSPDFAPSPTPVSSPAPRPMAPVSSPMASAGNPVGFASPMPAPGPSPVPSS